jgi:membrane-bound metal-dependent hydrolase YbcI (DUF457 family)
MAQVGIHSLLILPIKKLAPSKKGLLFGILLGSIFPDVDNFAVAIATLTGKSVEGLHRTYTHSLVTAVGIVLIFYILGMLFKNKNIGHLGLGLGVGVVLHIGVDLLVWFNGVELFWPFPGWVNLWTNVTPPEFWKTLMNPLEFLFIALFFIALRNEADKMGTDLGFLPKLRTWTYVQAGLFVVFLVLVYTMSGGLITTIYGALYLLSLILLIWVVFKMRNTVEANYG